MNRQRYNELRALVRANGLAYVMQWEMTPDEIAVFTVLEEQSDDNLTYRNRRGVRHNGTVKQNLKLWPACDTGIAYTRATLRAVDRKARAASLEMSHA